MSSPVAFRNDDDHPAVFAMARAASVPIAVSSAFALAVDGPSAITAALTF